MLTVRKADEAGSRRRTPSSLRWRARDRKLPTHHEWPALRKLIAKARASCHVTANAQRLRPPVAERRPSSGKQASTRNSPMKNPPLRKLVRFAFKLSASVPPLSQKQWEDRLLAAGADLRTARRIVFFAPNTAARVWLRDKQVQFPEHYVVFVPPEGAKSMTKLPLAPEPVFQACLLAAEQCSKGPRGTRR